MKLTELEPQFVKLSTGPLGSFCRVDTLSESDGVLFLCPVCFEQNKGAVGTHSILCWKPHVPLSIRPGPGRWRFEGTDLSNLTFNNIKIASSVDLRTNPPLGCQAHFMVERGEIRLV